MLPRTSQDAESESTALLAKSLEESESVGFSSIEPKLLKDESMHLLRLGIPSILQHTVDVLPQILIVMMISHVNNDSSKLYIAATSLSGLFYRLTVRSVITGLSSVTSILSSQEYGANNKSIGVVIQAGVLAMVISLVPLIFLLLNCSNILIYMGQEEDIAHLAGHLILFQLPSIPFYALFNLQSGVLQGQNIVIPLVYIEAFGQLFMCLSAYLLMYHTSIGIVGVIVAGSLTEMFKCLIISLYFRTNRFVQDGWSGWDIATAWRYLPQVSKMCVYGITMSMSLVFAKYIITILAGHLPDGAANISAVAGYNILVSSLNVVIQGISIAGSIRVGNALGSFDIKRAQSVTILTLGFAVFCGIFTCLSMLILSEFFAGIYINDLSVRRNTVALIHVTAPFQIAMAVFTGVLAIMQGCAKQNLCAILSISGYGILGFPLGAIFAYWFKNGVVGLWSGVMIGLTIVSAYGFLWIFRLNWKTIADEISKRTK